MGVLLPASAGLFNCRPGAETWDLLTLRLPSPVDDTIPYCSWARHWVNFEPATEYQRNLSEAKLFVLALSGVSATNFSREYLRVLARVRPMAGLTVSVVQGRLSDVSHLVSLNNAGISTSVGSSHSSFD